MAETRESNKRERHMLGLALLVLALIGTRFFFSVTAVPLQLMEWKLQNLIHSTATPAPLNDEVVVLGVDDASLELKSAFPEDVEQSRTLQLIKQGWPWSREVYVDAATKLLDAGARCVMLDFMFTGPSGEHPEGDAKMRKLLDERPGKIVLAANFTEQTGLNGITEMLQKPWEGFVPDTNPPPSNVGFINYVPDFDNVVRAARFQRSILHDDRADLAHLDQLPSAPTAALRLSGLGDVVPNDDAPHPIRFTSPDAYPAYSVHEIFVPDMWQDNFKGGAVFKDKIVLIGPAAPHMQDYHVVPVGRILGVQVHAQVIAAALNHSYVSYLPVSIDLYLLIIAALAAWWLAAYWRRPLSMMFLLVALTLAGIGGCWVVFDRWSVVVNGVGALLCFDLTGVLCLSYDFMLERRQRKQLRDYLTRYFSPDVVALMLREPEQFRALQQGAHRTITVLFSDLRGFTTMSEKLTPQQVVKQLNQYFNRMVEVIHGHSGGIDKFIGDAIMAVWGWVGSENTEESIQKNAVQAVTTILRMREGMAQLNEQWRAEGTVELAFGVGIHSGEALVGDLGSERQSGFTVMGDTVNTSSRLESVTKEYGVDNVISETVWHRVKELFVCRSTDLVRVKGKTVPTPIFTVMSESTTAAPTGLSSFEEGVRLYRAGDFAGAKASFDAAAAAGLDDYLTQMYLKRCQALIAEPPATWDGVFVMTKK